MSEISIFPVASRLYRWSLAFMCAFALSSSIGLVASWSEEIRSTTFEGLPLDEPILASIRGVQLRIPAGYLAPWPRLANKNQVNEARSIQFNFWMPSRRYVEVNDTSIAGFSPREPGRPPSKSESYVVKVRMLQPVTLGETGYLSPEKRFENQTTEPGLSSYSFKQEDFGLVRFWRHDWPHPKPEPFTRFRHVEGTDPQVLLRCTPIEEPALNHICDGDVHFIADSLGFYVRISRNNLPQWLEIVLAARDLFNSWKIAP
jgi:hypothetical protein